MTRLTALLPALKEHWARTQPEILGGLQPGLSAEEITAKLAEVSVQPTAEVLEWWGWHNGIVEPPGVFFRITGSVLEFLPLDVALGLYRDSVSVSQMLLENGVGTAWPPQQFPWLAYGDGSMLALDLADPNAPDTPVYALWEDMERIPDDSPIAASMTDAVQIWLEMFDSGAWGFNASSGCMNVLDEAVEKQLVHRFGQIAR